MRMLVNDTLIVELKSQEKPYAVQDSEESINEILNIPKIPFDVSRHEKVLKLGSCTTKLYTSHIELDHIRALGNQPGSGFGIAQFREIVSKSIQIGCPGKIITEASTSYGSPHLFYLYMGMVPDSRKKNYVQTEYGFAGAQALNILIEHKEWRSSDLEKLKVKILNNIKEILCRELQLPKPISLDYIVKNKDFLLSLKDKKLDYVEEIFIPELLEILAKNPLDKYLSTGELGGVPMHLTEKGFERWKYCIENNLEFVPFRCFEHLNLSTEHQTMLNDILDKRANAAVSNKI